MSRFSGILRKATMLVAAMIGCGQPLPAYAQEKWAANDDDAVLFDVRLGQWRLGEGVRGYQTPGGTCVDLADVIMALDIPVRLDKKLRRATGWAFVETNTLTIDREANTVQNMNKTSKISDSAIYDTPEGWCVDTKMLGNWLGVELLPDTGNALLLIKSTSKLPVELAEERKARAGRVRPSTSFDLSKLPQSTVPYKGVKAPAVDVVVNTGVVREGGKGIKPEVQYELFASGEIGPVSYDARLASDRSGVPEALRVRAFRVDPDGRLFGGRIPATQAAIGDVSGYSTPIVSQGNIGRGAMITNRPLDRPDAFDHLDFRGEAPAGWDVELYRNGQLLAFGGERSNGRYEFLNIPLLYGQNRFEVVLYGPQGQIRREEKIVTVGFDSIPPRKTWYWAGVNQDGRDLFTLGGAGFGTGIWRATLGIERGIDKRTSVQLGLHSLGLREVGRRNFLEGSIRRAIGPALFEFSYANDLTGGHALRGSVLGQLAGIYVSGESIYAMGGFQSDRVLSGVLSRHSLAADRNFTIGRSIIPVHLDARYTTRRGGQREFEVLSRVSANIGRTVLTNEIVWRTKSGLTGPGDRNTLETALLGHARFGRLRIRGEARFLISPTTNFQSIGVVGEWSGQGDIRDAADFRGEFAYDRSLDRARFGLGYVRRFDKFSITASAEAATDGSVAFGLNLAFSLGADPRHKGKVRVSSSHQASQGQVMVVVFRDSNGDGIRQAEEPAEKDVQITAGTAPVRDLTDTTGHVIVGDVQPYVPLLIGIDASSLPDPLIKPATPGMVVTPRPGVTAIVELPLVGTGEIDGTLIKLGGNGLAGVDLELVDANGNVVARTRTDFDGFFLFESVPYGQYQVRVAKISADIVQIKTGLSGLFRIDGNDPSKHLGIVAGDSLISVGAAGE